jgi:hypothetical protein
MAVRAGTRDADARASVRRCCPGNSAIFQNCILYEYSKSRNIANGSKKIQK